MGSFEYLYCPCPISARCSEWEFQTLKMHSAWRQTSCHLALSLGSRRNMEKSQPKTAFINGIQAWWHRAPMGTVTRAAQQRQEQGVELPAWAILTAQGRLVKNLLHTSKLVRREKKTQTNLKNKTTQTHSVLVKLSFEGGINKWDTE